MTIGAVAIRRAQVLGPGTFGDGRKNSEAEGPPRGDQPPR
jgi:hypothetical protein